ncbi:hypothetical protein [Brucella anthropi]|uniref:Uncharacterized protein n=1 Tax=Brucella anthropi TaxID=529 RepID=A0A6L3YZ99_BRUAN|nr:hypothetical protein [Brucella anthropi]KAB2761985.1 hypothetical protein F9L04_23045 [Brucella anthropi]UVV66701.1 hypothetical protein NW321_09445 [Brucella anthropi]
MSKANEQREINDLAKKMWEEENPNSEELWQIMTYKREIGAIVRGSVPDETREKYMERARARLGK